MIKSKLPVQSRKIFLRIKIGRRRKCSKIRLWCWLCHLGSILYKCSTVYFKWVNCGACELYLNKAVLFCFFKCSSDPEQTLKSNSWIFWHQQKVRQRRLPEWKCNEPYSSHRSAFPGSPRCNLYTELNTFPSASRNLSSLLGFQEASITVQISDLRELGFREFRGGWDDLIVITRVGRLRPPASKAIAPPKFGRAGTMFRLACWDTFTACQGGSLDEWVTGYHALNSTIEYCKAWLFLQEGRF